MLNQQLFKALQLAFKGGVEIESEDVPADIEETTFKQSNVGWQIVKGSSHGEQYRVNCPFCRDTKHHLYISYTSYASPVIDGNKLMKGPLVAQCFKSQCLRKPENRTTVEVMIQQALDCIEDGVDVAPIIATGMVPTEDVSDTPSTSITLEGIRDWVPTYMPIGDNTPGFVSDYLISRRVTVEDVNNLHIGYGQIVSPRTGEFIANGGWFIIFPITQNYQLTGVQARLIPSTAVNTTASKYWFHPKCRKATQVYNIDNARNIGLGVLCEGIFDVISVGKAGICSFGHTPSVGQERLIATLDKGLIILPDTDVSKDLNCIDKADKLAAKLLQTCNFPLGVYVVKLPKKDAGECTRNEIWSTILNNVPEPMVKYICDSVLEKL